jgi:hemerythrin
MRAEAEKLKRLSSESLTFNPAMLMEFLKGWLSKHIGETDRMYVPVLKAAGLS